MPANELPQPKPTELSFALRLRLETATQPWRATLLPSDGSPLEFDSLLDLLRHLGQLSPCHPASGGLR